MPIGPIDDDGKQYIIIKVTKRRTATKIFRERRTQSELLNRKKYVKFCTSLMGQWLNLLLYALYLRVKTEEIIFMYLYIYGKLMIRLKEPVDSQQGFSFRNKAELAEILVNLHFNG